MDKTLLFSIALVFCFDICIISAEKASEVDLIISQTANYTPVDTSVNKAFHLNVPGLKAAPADGTLCNNDTDCMYEGGCNSDGTCWCRDGTYGPFCQHVRACIRNPKMCGNGTDVKCIFNPYKNKAECSCDDKKKLLDPSTKKCAEPCRKYVKDCGEYGHCKYGFCSCVEGVSGGRCEIVDQCASGEVDCSGDPSATCALDIYGSGHGQAYCKCNKKYQHFDEEEKRCKGECKCANGRCMRRCDVEKTTPCIDDDMVCVCNPEYGRKDDFYCEHCNCGQGFNCTFYVTYRWEKTCDCPEGYYFRPGSVYDSGGCEAECNDERPCQNGGTCSDLKRCDCPRDTSGALCEEIFYCYQCVNRLEVDCLYDQSQQTNYCSCKNSSLYYDYDAKICKPCPCGNGNCEYEISYSQKRLKCNCHSGYKEFNGYCKKCECDFSTIGDCEFDPKGERICRCQDGYYERNGGCLPCGCTMYGDLDTKCEMAGNVKHCFCEEGFQDTNGHCEDINECETNNTCHPPAVCHNTFGSFYCQCPEGYRGTDGSRVEPGEVCEDINECKELAVPCRVWDNVMCVNLPGSYKCQCFQGYKPERYAVQPRKTTCVKTSKSWAPTVIVIFIALVLMVVSGLVYKYVKNRVARSN